MGWPESAHFLAYYGLLQVNARLMEAVGREFERDAGFPLAWYEVLAHLHFDGRLRMNELADHLLLSRGGVTRLIARMEERGLVRRETPRDDRRATFAVLTPEGAAAFERATPLHKASVHRHFHEHLDDDDVRALLRVFAKVLRPEDCAGLADAMDEALAAPTDQPA